MVDIHAHLLNKDVKFDRLYDKIAIKFFASKLGINPQKLIDDPYNAYTDAVIKNIRESKHLKKSVLFGVDSRLDLRGNLLHNDLTVCASNDSLLELYEKNRDIIIPFFSINPLRPDALDLIDRYSELGFRGAKFLQNYWGVDLNQDRFIPYFEKLKSKNIPLIIHIGSESSVHSYKDCESIDMLDTPLEIGVNVIAAHMALSYTPLGIFKALSQNPKHFNDEYHKLLFMLETHDNLYADISAILTPVRAKVLRHLSCEKSIHHKLLFGTDYPVPFTSMFNSYDLSFKKRIELSKIENPYDRYIGAILEYFTIESAIFSNYEKIL
jgi:predicted TIM-barrel fold metal-dependent hydrolase